MSDDNKLSGRETYQRCKEYVDFINGYAQMFGVTPEKACDILDALRTNSKVGDAKPALADAPVASKSVN